jgi:hypothetical protein
MTPTTLQRLKPSAAKRHESSTFEALHRGTRGLSGSARAEIFYSLPATVQAETWRNLAERVERERGDA